jgi:predicted O-methyltransferase YrrM
MPHTSPNAAPVRLSLLNPALVRPMLERLAPLGHHACSVGQAIEHNDLGLGLLYYAFARVLRPERVLIVGSLRGFTVGCIALALEDNGRGEVDFVDAAKVDDFWTRSESVRSHFAAFNIEARIRVHVMTTAKYAAMKRDATPDLDFLFIDGDHSEAGTRFDHRQLGRLVRPGGYIFFHDAFAAGALFSEWQVAEYLGSLDHELHEILNVDTSLGLAILRKLPPEPTAREETERLRRLVTSCRAAVGARRPAAEDEQIATLALDVLRDQRQKMATLRSQLRFLRKANRDLWRQLLKRT